jgi:hypothetical protein
MSALRLASPLAFGRRLVGPHARSFPKISRSLVARSGPTSLPERRRTVTRCGVDDRPRIHCLQVFPLLAWRTEAAHYEVSYAKRESSPSPAGPAIGAGATTKRGRERPPRGRHQQFQGRVSGGCFGGKGRASPPSRSMLVQSSRYASAMTREGGKLAPGSARRRISAHGPSGVMRDGDRQQVGSLVQGTSGYVVHGRRSALTSSRTSSPRCRRRAISGSRSTSGSLARPKGRDGIDDRRACGRVDRVPQLPVRVRPDRAARRLFVRRARPGSLRARQSPQARARQPPALPPACATSTRSPRAAQRPRPTARAGDPPTASGVCVRLPAAELRHSTSHLP